MENTKKLAEDYYNFILKYDECFYKKYKKEETDQIHNLNFHFETRKGKAN